MSAETLTVGSHLVIYSLYLLMLCYCVRSFTSFRGSLPILYVIACAIRLLQPFWIVVADNVVRCYKCMQWSGHLLHL